MSHRNIAGVVLCTLVSAGFAVRKEGSGGRKRERRDPKPQLKGLSLPLLVRYCFIALCLFVRWFFSLFVNRIPKIMH